MDLFAGMDVNAAKQGNNAPPQQPQQTGSSMPGLFAGMNFVAAQPAGAQSTQVQKPQTHPLGSAFGIQIGALSTLPTISATPENIALPEGAKNTLSLFQGMSQPAPQPQQPAPQISMFGNLNLAGSPAPKPEVKNPTSTTGGGYSGPSFDIQPTTKPVADNNTLATFGFGAQPTAQAAQAVLKPKEDPFEQVFVKQESAPTNVSHPKEVPKIADKNESFEEIKINTTADSAAQPQEKNKSIDQAAQPQFMINNQPVSKGSIGEVIAAKQKPPQKGFLKSAFNFMTGGILGGTDKQAYAPKIPPAQPNAQFKPPASKQIGGVTIVTAFGGSGMSESNAPISAEIQKDEALSPIGNKSIGITPDNDRSTDSTKIPQPQSSSFNSSFNFIGLATPYSNVSIPEHNPATISSAATNTISSFLPISTAQPVNSQDSTVSQKEQAKGSLFDFMNMSSQSNTSNQAPLTSFHHSSSLPENWSQANIHPVSNNEAAQSLTKQEPVPQSGGDLFSMLNQNISQSTTQNNPILAGSAFNFMQNQSSLSNSMKSETTYQPTQQTQNPTTRLNNTQVDYEEFEELSESREIIEDRIFRLKLQMIDLMITQMDLSAQQSTLAADIKILQNQKNQASRNEAQAAERENYEEAEKLNLKIQSIKQLIGSKEAHSKKLDEDITSLESRKGDKYVELCQLVEKSRIRLNEIRTSQQAEMNTYEETEQLAVDEKKKRLHYERIRITEDQEEVRQQKEQVERIEAEIDEQVYEDTKDQHIEKHRLDNEVDELDQEIAALEQQLALKRKAREALVLEKNVYEKQIALAKSKYQTKINKQAILKDKLQKKKEKLEQDNLDYNRESELLADYEEHFKSKLRQFEQELDDIASLEVYLNRAKEKISITLNAKKACLESQFTLKQERHGLSTKLQNQQDTMEHRKEQIQQVESSVEDTKNQLLSIEQRRLKVEAEKKKYAAQRKFKEASTCQAQLKSLQSEQENYERFKTEFETKKAYLEEEAATKNEELKQIEDRIAELTKMIEQEHQKYLTYRIYDCSDMIKVLRPFCQDHLDNAVPLSSLMKDALSIRDAKDKRHHLEQEQIKMQKELLELELKYGPYKIDLPKDEDEPMTEKFVKRVEEPEAVNKDLESSMQNSAFQTEQNELSPVVTKTIDIISEEKIIEANPAQLQKVIQSKSPQPIMNAQELRESITELLVKLGILDRQISQVCEDEDFELADQLQQQLDETTELLEVRKAALEALGETFTQGVIVSEEDPHQVFKPESVNVDVPAKKYEEEESKTKEIAAVSETKVNSPIPEKKDETEHQPISSFSFLMKSQTTTKAPEEAKNISLSAMLGIQQPIAGGKAEPVIAPQHIQEVQTTQEEIDDVQDSQKADYQPPLYPEEVQIPKPAIEQLKQEEQIVQSDSKSQEEEKEESIDQDKVPIVKSTGSSSGLPGLFAGLIMPPSQ